MTAAELDKLAYAGEEMPEGLRLHQQQYFLAMRSLYREYKRKDVNKEQSAREKTALLKAYERGEHHEEYVEKVEGLWGRISLAAAAYIKEPCLTTAEAFYRAVFNLPENHRKQPIEILPEQGQWDYVLVEE